jgi:hypothetical protein
LTSGTANGVAYLNGSKVLTTGSALVFDGSNLGLGVTPSAWGSGWKAEQLGNYGAFITGRNSSNQLFLGVNAYFNGTDWIYANTSTASRYYQSSGLHYWETAASGTAGNAITFTQAMTLDASGNLGIGTTSPSSRLDISGTTTIKHTYTGSANPIQFGQFDSSGNASINNQANAALLFGTNNTERARIDSSGNLLVGTTSTAGSSIGFKVSTTTTIPVVNVAGASSTNGNTCYEMYSTTASAYRFYVGFGGTIYATSTTISSLSDQRHKENIRDLNVGLSEVMALKPRLFDWKEGKGADVKNARGFIAQEFEEVFPDLIDTWKEAPPEGEDPYKSVRADLIPVLVKAIQEMKSIIDDQAARIAALETK